MCDERRVKCFRAINKKNTATSEHVERVCIIHFKRHKKWEEVRPLTEHSFATIQSSVDIRSRQDNFVHQLIDICRRVPKTFDSTHHGAHRWCYKQFTNTARLKLKEIISAAITECQSLSTAEQRGAVIPTVTSSGLFPAICLFCGTKKRVVNRKPYQLLKCHTLKAEANIKRAAQEKKDFVILNSIANIDMVAMEVQYHECCRRNYVLRPDRSHRAPSFQDESYLHNLKEQRAAYDAAFEHICQYIEEEVIGGGNVMHLAILREKYLKHILDNTPKAYNPNHKTHKFKERIVRHFGDRVEFWQPKGKGELLFSSGNHIQPAVEVAVEIATTESEKLEEAAMILHRHILHAQFLVLQTSSPPSVDCLLPMSSHLPPSLTEFLKIVVTGKTSQCNSHIVSSIAEELCKAAAQEH